MASGETTQAARQAAIGLLARREYSARELQLKLRASQPEEAIAEAIESLQAQGLQSDQRFASTWLRHRLLQGYGPQRIQQELRQKGIADELLRSCLQDEAIDWFAQASEVFQRKFGRRPPKDAKEKAKAMRFMQYRGFTSDQIRHVLRSDD